jgi:hypothetical protein
MNARPTLAVDNDALHTALHGPDREHPAEVHITNLTNACNAIAAEIDQDRADIVALEAEMAALEARRLEKREDVTRRTRTLQSMMCAVAALDAVSRDIDEPAPKPRKAAPRRKK